MKKLKKGTYWMIVGGFFFLVILIFTINAPKNDSQLIKEGTGETQSTGVFTGRLFTATPKIQIAQNKEGDTQKCLDIRKEIDELFEQSQRCNKDSDCIVENKGMFCPFGCYQIHNKAIDITSIMQKVLDFQEQKCFLCEYSCMAPPEPKDLKCQQNRCVDIRYPQSK